MAASATPLNSAHDAGIPPQACPRRVFVDLDGVVVDFDRFRDDRCLTGDQVKSMPGAYLDMPAMPGAIEAVRSLIGMGYEVWLATKPPTGIPHAYSDKVAWVLQHLPELKRRIIITHDKGLLGCANDFLCDDRPHKANCEQFPGTLLRFVDGFHWPQALEFFRTQRAARDATQRPAGDGGQGGQWVSCSPALIASGVDCGKTPRRPSHLNHEHFIAPGVAPAAACAQQDQPSTGDAQA